MKRTRLSYLETWLTSSDRKPLVLRGARQVGKTWLARQLAQTGGKKLIEINFEKQPSMASLFSSNNPYEILLNLSSLFPQAATTELCLLFLDEIQTAM